LIDGFVLAIPGTGGATNTVNVAETCTLAAKGGDAVQFRSREASDYQVSILGVAGSSASDRDILSAEQLWMRKLQTNEMGLNGGTMRDGVSMSPFTSAG
jgi:hypothetical protein